jgi:hypothetical protein
MAKQVSINYFQIRICEVVVERGNGSQQALASRQNAQK